MLIFDVHINKPDCPTTITQRFTPREKPYTKYNCHYSAFDTANVPPKGEPYTVICELPSKRSEDFQITGNVEITQTNFRTTFKLSGESSSVNFYDINHNPVSFTRIITE